MLAKTREVGTATLVGLTVGGVIETILGAGDIQFSFAIGAFIGGAVGAYFLYGKLGFGAIVGALSGLLSTLFYLGLSQILLIFEVIPIPPGQQPPMSELQVAVMIIVGFNLVAGTIGGAVGGGIHHKAQPAEIPQLAGTVPTPGQNKYCVQCGAQLPSGTLICPHCNARQP